MAGALAWTSESWVHLQYLWAPPSPPPDFWNTTYNATIQYNHFGTTTSQKQTALRAERPEGTLATLEMHVKSCDGASGPGFNFRARGVDRTPHLSRGGGNTPHPHNVPLGTFFRLPGAWCQKFFSYFGNLPRRGGRDPVPNIYGGQRPPPTT